MAHANSSIHCASPDCAGRNDTPNHGLPAFTGKNWRSALGTLTAAPLRLHRYRHFHAEVVEDAIRAYDCGKCS